MDAITTVSDKAAALSDDDLVERVKHLVTCERRASVSLIRSLLEFWLPQLRLLSAARDQVAAPPAPRFRAAIVTPLAPEHYRLQVTLSRETHETLRRAQTLARHAVPDGDVGSILDRALTLLIDHLERRRFARAAAPRASPSDSTASGRYIPAAVRREVRQRHEGRCAFIGRTGRCRETAFLEFHHVAPYAAGGAATADNIQLRCRAHNQYEAGLFFGDILVRERQEMWSTVDRSD